MVDVLVSIFGAKLLFTKILNEKRIVHKLSDFSLVFALSSGKVSISLWKINL